MRGVSLVAEDAQRGRLFLDEWRPRVEALTHARNQTMLRLMLGEVAEQVRFFEQAVGGDGRPAGQEHRWRRETRIRRQLTLARRLTAFASFGAAHVASPSRSAAISAIAKHRSVGRRRTCGVHRSPDAFVLHRNGARRRRRTPALVSERCRDGPDDARAAASARALLASNAPTAAVRTAPNAARTLDLDLILYGDAVIDEPGLVVPHPRFRDRAFVLVPLAEIAGDMVDPVTGLTVGAWRPGSAPPGEVVRGGSASDQVRLPPT